MATIKSDVKQAIIHFWQRENQMNVADPTIAAVEAKGGFFGGKQHKAWLAFKQNLIQHWIDDYLGYYSRLTTWEELDSWAEEAKLPVTLIINNFGHLCKDGYGRKPSKGSVIMMAQEIQRMKAYW